MTLAHVAADTIGTRASLAQWAGLVSLAIAVIITSALTRPRWPR